MKGYNVVRLLANLRFSLTSSIKFVDSSKTTLESLWAESSSLFGTQRSQNIELAFLLLQCFICFQFRKAF